MAFGNACNPGCGCCSTGCYGISGRLYGCSSFGSPVYSGTVTGPDGSEVRIIFGVGSGNYTIQTKIDGVWRSTALTGDYTITINRSGHYSRTFTVSHVCSTASNYPVYLHPTSFTFRVAAKCFGADTATVTISGLYSGSATVDGWVYTDPSSGTITVEVSDPGGDPHTVPGCFTITVSLDRYEDYVETRCWDGFRGVNCVGTLPLNTPSDCYDCCLFGSMYPESLMYKMTTPWGVDVILDARVAGPVYYTGPTTPMRNPLPCYPYGSGGCDGPFFDGNPPMSLQWSCTNIGTFGCRDFDIQLAFRYACDGGTALSGFDNCQGPFGAFNVHWTSVVCGEPNQGRSMVGHITRETLNEGVPPSGFYDDPSCIAFRLIGEYAIEEIPCSGGRSMSFRVAPSSPVTILDESGIVVGFSIADDSGTVEVALSPFSDDPAWVVSGDDEPRRIGGPADADGLHQLS